MSLRWIVLVILLAFLAAMPKFLVSYYVQLTYAIFLYTTLAASYDLVGGHMGYMNLGHAIFYGLGTYAFGLAFKAGGGLVGGLATAAAVAVLFAAAMSYPFFRMRGAYFALGTLGLIFLMELLGLNLRGITQGAHGLDITPGDRLNPVYYLALALVVSTLGTVYVLSRSRYGLALRSIREDEEAAASFGIDVMRYKVMTLMLSAFFAGLMGGLNMWHESYINPEEAFGLEIAFVPIVMAMVGGTGLVSGPVVGVILVYVIQEVLWTRIGFLQVAMYGFLLMLVGVLMPGGVVRYLRLDRLFPSDYKPRTL
ncbi:MAG: branched-chain amino acid ABC transporter permease [Nitrospinota bacterium]